MGKTRANIQKAYRERRKAKEGEKYLEKERKRVKGYYVPTADLSSDNLTNRRARNKQNVAKHRLKNRSSSSLLKDKITISSRTARRNNELRDKLRKLEKEAELLRKANARMNKRNQRKSTDRNEPLQITAGNWVAAVYENKWYIGQVLRYDKSDGTYSVNCLEATNMQGTKFKYHSPPNELWINAKDMICIIEEPTFNGKTKHSVKITLITADTIQSKFSQLS